MHNRPTDHPGLGPECEPDPCFSLTICSYGDGGGVSGSQTEIDNVHVAHFFLISEEGVNARVNVP